jgi:hypothetical protein
VSASDAETAMAVIGAVPGAQVAEPAVAAAMRDGRNTGHSTRSTSPPAGDRTEQPSSPQIPRQASPAQGSGGDASSSSTDRDTYSATDGSGTRSSITPSDDGGYTLTKEASDGSRETVAVGSSSGSDTWGTWN